MVRTYILRCDLPRAIADSLNRESGRIYTRVMVEHYRIYRKHGQWLCSGQAEKLDDTYHVEEKRILHAHSIDAAQQGFYEACKTAKTNKANKVEGAKHPHWRKHYRTTTWKSSGIHIKEGSLLLSLARGQHPVRVNVPEALLSQDLVQVELVYNKSSRRYHWHVTTDDGVVAKEAQGKRILAGDLGEIHPCALSDGEETIVVCCRDLRATKQYTHKRLAELSERQARCVKGSRNWWRLQERKNRFLAQQGTRVRDMENKISHEIVEVAQEKGAAQLVLGDVRDIADGKRLSAKSQQKISTWGHGKLRNYVKYKAEAQGIAFDDSICEKDTSKTCPNCGHQAKPRGRTYRCTNPACGLVAHRDGVGAVNILSRRLHGEVAKIKMPARIKYRYPILSGKRSPSGTGEMAPNDSHRSPHENRSSQSSQQEAAGL